MSYFVKIIFSPDLAEVGTKILIEEGQTLVGRVSPPCKIKLDGEKVSKKHCSFLLNNEELKIVDHNSSNGIYVNRKKVPECFLKEKDLIVLGEYTLEVTVK